MVGLTRLKVPKILLGEKKCVSNVTAGWPSLNVQVDELQMCILAHNSVDINYRLDTRFDILIMLIRAVSQFSLQLTYKNSAAHMCPEWMRSGLVDYEKSRRQVGL